MLGIGKDLSKTVPQIRSISVTLENQVKNTPLSAEKVKKEVDQLMASHERYLAGLAPAARKAMAANFTREKTESAVVSGYGSKSIHSNYLIWIDEHSIKMRQNKSSPEPNKSRVLQTVLLYERSLYPAIPNQRRESFSWIPEQRTGHIIQGGIGSFEVRYLGRLQGIVAEKIFELCQGDTDEQIATLIKQEVGHPSITGEFPYDKDGIAKKITIKNGNINVAVIACDQAKGRICPLVQLFDSKTGKMTEEYLSSGYFLHEQSGLWFPTLCVRNTYDEKSGVLQQTSEYRIDQQSLLVNQPVSVEEFAVPIPEDSIVCDCRQNEKQRDYIASQSGTISLAAGGFDLDKMTWLERRSSNEEVLAEVRKGSFTSMILRYTGGVLLILFLLLILFYRKRLMFVLIFLLSI